MSTWKSQFFYALVKQQFDDVEAIISDGDIPKEHITIRYSENCIYCPDCLEYPIKKHTPYLDVNLAELMSSIDSGRCSCLHSVDNDVSNGFTQSVSPLHLACLYGPISLVKRLIHSGFDIHEPSHLARFTPLHYLSQSFMAPADVVEIAGLLLQLGVDVGVQDRRNETALHLAIRKHHTELALLLIDSNSPINVVNSDGETPLLTATKLSEDEIVVRLCERDADPNITDRYHMLALNVAISESNNKIINAILNNRRLDPNRRGVPREGYASTSPILLATSRGYVEVVELLLTRGADPDSMTQDKHRPLIIAAFANSVDIARCLIRFQADVNAMEQKGYSPIHYAAWEGHTEMVKILLEAGAHSDVQTQDLNTPLSLACHGDYISTISLLLDQDPNVNNQDKDLDTPLHYCAYNGNLDASQLLMKRGAKPDLENSFHVTPIWNAVYAKALSLVQLLIQCNVRLNVPSRGISQHAETHNPALIFDTPRSPLYVACMMSSQIAKTLVLAGVNLGEESWFWSGDAPTEMHNDKKFYDWICREAFTPVTLLRQTRHVIRQILGVHPQQKVQTLLIPEVLKDFLLIKSFPEHL